MVLRALALVLWASVAGAQEAQQAFADWAQSQRVTPTAMAVIPGATGPSGPPVDLASNSKVITALCVLQLVEEGLLDWSTPLARALGRPAPPATLAQIVTHSGGIGPDSTQRRMRSWLNDPVPRHDRVTDIVLARAAQSGEPGRYSYNNENYALLASVIEKATGTPYVGACTARLLRPLGLGASLSPHFGAYAAWGGWRMTTGDHARLLHAHFGPDGAMGRSPMAFPHIRIGDNAWYGLGMLFRRDPAGWRFSHAGALKFLFGPQTGAYAVVFPNGAAISTGYDRAVTDPAAFRALDRALAAALGLP